MQKYWDFHHPARIIHPGADGHNIQAVDPRFGHTLTAQDLANLGLAPIEQSYLVSILATPSHEKQPYLDVKQLVVPPIKQPY